MQLPVHQQQSQLQQQHRDDAGGEAGDDAGEDAGVDAGDVFFWFVFGYGPAQHCFLLTRTSMGCPCHQVVVHSLWP